MTRRQVDQERQSADRAIEAVRRASEEIQALEAAMNDGQASLLAAKSAVDAASASVARYLGDEPGA